MHIYLSLRELGACTVMRVAPLLVNTYQHGTE